MFISCLFKILYKDMQSQPMDRLVEQLTQRGPPLENGVIIGRLTDNLNQSCFLIGNYE